MTCFQQSDRDAPWYVVFILLELVIIGAIGSGILSNFENFHAFYLQVPVYFLVPSLWDAGSLGGLSHELHSITFFSHFFPVFYFE